MTEMESILQLRETFREEIPKAGLKDSVWRIEDIEVPYAGHQSTRTKIYIPFEAMNQAPILFFIHGGGWVSGDLDTHEVLARKLALDNHAIVVYPEYCLAPEQKFPYQIYELENCLDWVVKNSPTFGGNPEQLFLIGDSAGGNMVASLSLKNKYEQHFKFSGQILLYPAMSFLYNTESIKTLGSEYFPTTEFFELIDKMYLEQAIDKYNLLVSPVLGNLENMPSTLVITAGKDPLRDEGKDYADRLKQLHQDVQHRHFEDELHGFVQFFKKEDVVGGWEALSDIHEWLKIRTK